MALDTDFQSLVNDAFAKARPAPVVDMDGFIHQIGLDKIGPYSYQKILSGGGTNFAAIYEDNGCKAVAKFFFTGPAGNGDAACDRELKMLKLCRSQELTSGILVSPRLIQEFFSIDKMVVGFLMEFVEGEPLWDVIGRIQPGDLHATMTTFVRVGWARHNALRASILHKDLHPGNIIFEMSNDDWEQWITKAELESPRVRILDFGSAVMPMQFDFDDFDVNWYQDLMRYFNGAFTCVAPEFFTKDFRRSLAGSQAFDCWALGHMLYRIYTGKLLDIAKSVGTYCDSIYSGQLSEVINCQIEKSVKDHRLKFLISSMLQPDYKKRVNLFNAIEYANYLRRKDHDIEALVGEELYQFVYEKGCDPEWGLPPHERSNSVY